MKRIKSRRLMVITGLLLLCSIFTVLNAQSLQPSFEPPEIILNPSSEDEYKPVNRKFTGIPSLAVTPGGRLWAVWYAGPAPGEDRHNYVVVSTSGDGGKSWEEVLVVDPDGPGPVRAYDPEIWIDPLGKLWVFWAQAKAREEGTWSMLSEGTPAGVWVLRADHPESEAPKWQSPERLTDGVMMCKPLVLSTGEWVLPASSWKKERHNARMVVSTDQGLSWQVRGGASVPDEVRSFDEQMIVERKDGSLWMLIRTRYGIGQSISHDRGFTWSPVVQSGIQHPSARFFIRRLHSGNLLLVKHGPVDMQTGRSHLMAFISRDDGYTWSDGLLLDQRPGVSYPDGQQTRDGKIYIVWDYNRTREQQVLFSWFTEEEILNGTDRNIVEVFQRRKVISRGGIPEK